MRGRGIFDGVVVAEVFFVSITGDVDGKDRHGAGGFGADKPGADESDGQDSESGPGTIQCAEL